MKRVFVFLFCFSGIFLQGCATHSVSKPSAEKHEQEKETRTAALQWLQLVDAGDYAQAQEEESARFRASTTEAQFDRSMQGRRGRLFRPNFNCQPLFGG
jgi:hypothetical protein